MKFTEFIEKLEEIAPRSLSAEWDNDGVMCRCPQTDEVSKVLVALDPTEKAIKYAAEGGFDLLVTHHPLIFKGVKSLTGEDVVTHRAITALLSSVSVVSLHTRLDAAKGGVNDALAAILGLRVTGIFGDSEAPELGRICELEREMTAEELALLVKEKLGASSVRLTGGGKVKNVALVGGDGKSFVAPAMAAGADLLITGDGGYNILEAAAEEGFSVIEAGHYHTEFPVCEKLCEYLRGLGLEAEVFDYCPYKNI